MQIPGLELFETLFGRVIELMTLALPMSTSQHEERDAAATAIIILPSTCKQFLALSKRDARWPWIAMYERMRLGYDSAGRLHLFDGIPAAIRSLDLASPMIPTPVNKLAMSTQISEKRVQYVNKVERHFDENSHKVVSVAALPPALPYRVALVAQGLFKHYRSLQHHKPEYIHICAHKRCGRVAIDDIAPIEYEGTRLEIGGILKHSEFWLVAGFNVEEYLRNVQRYCCSQCRDQYADEVISLTFPDAFNNPPSNYTRQARNNARGCPLAHSLRSLLSRNAEVACAIRASESRKLVAMSHSERTSLQQRVIKALNVETAVVMAAIEFSELPRATRRTRIVGPRNADWRQYPIMYTRSMRQVREIYEERASYREPLLTTNNASPRWMQTVRSRLLNIF